MVRRVLLAALSAFLVSGISELAARPLTDAAAPVTVVLCDRAGAASADKVTARAQVDRILLQSARLRLRWVESETCVGPELETYLSIIIVSERPNDLAASSSALGRAVLVETPYPRAYVFLGQVRRFDLANSGMNKSSTFGVMLGHAMAHELGHMLGLSHTPAGIMRAEWGRKEWVAAVAGVLMFSHAQLKLVKLLN